MKSAGSNEDNRHLSDFFDFVDECTAFLGKLLEGFFPSFETAVLPIDILHEIQTQLRRAVGAYGVREPEECEVTNSSDALGDRGAFAFSQGSGLFSRHSRLRGNLFPGHLLAIRIEIAGIALLDAIVHNISDTDRER